MASNRTGLERPRHSQSLTAVVDAIRHVVAATSDVADIATDVGEALRASLPGPDVLTPQQQLGHPDHYEQHILHVEPGGEFSIVGLVWRPGQSTPIHDHVCWCVVGVIAGTEEETLYEVRDEPAASLNVVGRRRNPAGTVCSFAPPGDIHDVRNAGRSTAVSLHVYGADISAIGTSIRRRYTLPVK